MTIATFKVMKYSKKIMNSIHYYFFKRPNSVYELLAYPASFVTRRNIQSLKIDDFLGPRQSNFEFCK